MVEPEAGWSQAGKQLAQLYRRARAYPLRVLVTALLFSAAVVGFQVIKEHAFHPRFVMRVVEADRDAQTAPRMKRQLREYVMGAVFSNGALQKLLAKHGLYPSLARKNPQAALESFREDIEVEVYRNYFVEDRSAQGAPRSARIAVSYRSENRDLALAVTRDLGDLVVSHEHAARRGQANNAADRARSELARARARYIAHKRSMHEKVLLPGDSPDEQGLARVQLTGMVRTLEVLERDLEIAEHRSATLDLGKGIEDHELGLLFQTVDRGEIPRSAEREPRDLVLLGALTFIFGLPLAAMAVGAFSRAIVNTEDLRQVPLPLLGEVRGLRIATRRHA